MSALKDLRELVNVSRLTFREEDSDEEYSAAARTPPPATSKPSRTKQPIQSHAEPHKKSTDITKPYVLDTARSSVILTDRNALLDRNSIPDVRLLKKKDELPSLGNYREDNKKVREEYFCTLLITLLFNKIF